MENNYEFEYNGKCYLVVDFFEKNNVTYYSCVELTKTKMPTTNYGVFKKYIKDNKEFLDIVRDNDELGSVLEEFGKKVARSMEESMPKLGSVVEYDDRDFVILQYVPYSNNMYTVLMTPDEPYEVMVCNVRDCDDSEITLENVSHTETANIVLQIYKIIATNKNKK